MVVGLLSVWIPPEKCAVFLKSLDDVVGEVKGMITLTCEAFKPRVSPTWRKDGTVLTAGPKYVKAVV